MRAYQIDLHGGLRKSEAVELFRKEYNSIIAGLKDGSIKHNYSGPTENAHIIKVICGYGHHSKGNHSIEDNPAIGALRKHFLQLFKSSGYDFAYLENYGVFLILVIIPKH